MKKPLRLFFLFCLLIGIGACVYAPVGQESGPSPAPVRPGYGGDYYREPEPGPGPGWDGRRIDVDIANLEATPRWFVSGQPIDFVARINNKGPAAAGFDIGIFHEGRLVGWIMDKTLAPGPNIFKVRDRGFTGDPGAYIVRIRRAGYVLDEKRFVTNRLPDGRFTIDTTHGAVPPPPPPPPPREELSVRIGNLEARPAFFRPGDEIDFVVQVDARGVGRQVVDVGVFHGRRLVGWERGKMLRMGANVFTLHDRGFDGDAGAYIVKVIQDGRTIAEKRFVTKKAGKGRFTIDPGQPRPPMP